MDDDSFHAPGAVIGYRRDGRREVPSDRACDVAHRPQGDAHPQDTDEGDLMAQVDWSAWVYDQLVAFVPLTPTLIPASSVYGQGSLTGPPEAKPFIVIDLGDEFTDNPGTSRQDLTVFVHDEVGSFNTINQLVRVVQDCLCGVGQRVGQVTAPGGIVCRWTTNGSHQADEGYGTLMRASNYELVGRDGSG